MARGVTIEIQGLKQLQKQMGELPRHLVVETDAEMAAVSAEMDSARSEYRRGDGRSWWAATADGVDRLVRMQGFDRHSPTTAELLEDPRLAAIGVLPQAGHVHGKVSSNRVEALFKPIGVVEGISDVPWHKDCSLGRHSYECCSLTVGISVTGADAGSGQLRVVAGSHRATCWPSEHPPGAGMSGRVDWETCWQRHWTGPGSRFPATHPPSTGCLW